jgi:alanine racemase
MGRNGFIYDSPLFAEALQALAHYQEQGLIQVEGIWSHLASSDTPQIPEDVAFTRAQHHLFEQFIERVENAGFALKYKHLSASAGILLYPEMHYNLVRPGIMLYGISPNPKAIDVRQHGISAALKLEAQMNNVKQVKAGSGISYGQIYHTKNDTSIGIVPLGYSDGIMRSSGGSDSKAGAPVLVGGKIAYVAGRVCMDQFMIDIGADTSAKAGDWVTLYGPGSADPDIADWAEAAGTIPYELLTNVTAHAPISYVQSARTGVVPVVQ